MITLRLLQFYKLILYSKASHISYKHQGATLKKNFALYTSNYLALEDFLILVFVALYSKYNTIRKINLLLYCQQISLLVYSNQYANLAMAKP